MSTNVTLTGTLGRDPELRFTASGKAVVTLSVVTSKSIKNDDGSWENQEETWWRVSAWEKLAENVAATLLKGDPVVVVGRSFMEKYEDKEGNERQSLKVNAYNIGLDLKRRTAQVERSVGQGSPQAAREAISEPAGVDTWGEEKPPF